MSDEISVNLYRVAHDDVNLYVAGRSMAEAITQWRCHWQAIDPASYDPSEEPEQVVLVGEGEYEVFVKPSYEPPGEPGKEG